MSERTGTKAEGRRWGLPEWGAPELKRLALGMLVVTLVMLAIGFAITRLSIFAGLRAWDASVANWWVEQRTPTLDTVSHYATMMSDTQTAIAVTAIAFVLLRVVLGRWTESLVLLAAIGGELLYFLVLTTAVGRPRPDVPRLDEAPPTSSFPSGHTGAAVALYVCLAFIIWQRVAQKALAVPVAVVLCLIPVAVGLSRMYRGMHFFTDVVSGALGGLLWLLVVLAVLWPREEEKEPAPVEATADA